MQKSELETSLLLYQTEDGQTRIEVQLLGETLWLSQAQMCELFDKDKRTISAHIQNSFKEGELQENSTVRKFRTVQIEGAREVTRQVEHYNLRGFIDFWRFGAA